MKTCDIHIVYIINVLYINTGSSLTFLRVYDKLTAKSKSNDYSPNQIVNNIPSMTKPIRRRQHDEAACGFDSFEDNYNGCPVFPVKLVKKRIVYLKDPNLDELENIATSAEQTTLITESEPITNGLTSDSTATEDTTLQDTESQDTISDDTTTEQTTLEDTTPEDTTAEDTIPEDIVPEDTIPEDTTQEDTTPEDTTLEDTTTQDTTTPVTTSHDTTTEVTVPNNTITEDTLTEDTMPEEISEDIIIEEPITEDTILEDIVTEATTLEDTVTESIPQEDSPTEHTVTEESTIENTIPDDITTDDLLTDDAIPDDITIDDIMTDDTIPDDLIPDDTIPDDIIIEEPTTEGMLPEISTESTHITIEENKPSTDTDGKSTQTHPESTTCIFARCWEVKYVTPSVPTKGEPMSYLTAIIWVNNKPPETQTLPKDAYWFGRTDLISGPSLSTPPPTTPKRILRTNSLMREYDIEYI